MDKISSVWEFIQDHKKESLSVIILVIILTSIPVGLYLIKHPQIFKSKALEEKTDQKEPPKPEFVQGEILVKFRSSVPKLSVKSAKRGVADIDKKGVAFTDLEETSIPNSLKDLNQKYQIKEVEKVFKGAEEPKAELDKFKKRNSQELSSGKRKINEAELLKIDLSRTYKVAFSSKDPADQIAKEFSKNSDIEYAEPNYIYKTDDPLPTNKSLSSTTNLIPSILTSISKPVIATSFSIYNDPYFLDPNPLVAERSLSLSNGGWNPIGSDGTPLAFQWNLKKIGFPEAWSYIDSSTPIVVAVIDTGVDYNHPDLEGQIWENPGEIGIDNMDRDKKSNGIDDDNNGYIDD